MIEELISRGQQLDAVHFTYEVGLVDKFPPVPLLKAYLKDARKAAASIMDDPNNPGRAAVFLLLLHPESYILIIRMGCCSLEKSNYLSSLLGD